MADWINRIEGKPIGKDELIDLLLPRCYYFQKGSEGFRIVQVLNTAVMVTARDLADSKRRSEWLKQKIDMAIQYPLEGEDWKVLDKISKIRPPEHHYKEYLAWGLYLYLAGLVTVHPNSAKQDGSSMSFLSACRKVGFLNNNSIKNEDKLIEALKLLGLWDLKTSSGSFYIQELVQEWKTEGTFKVTGLSAQTEVITEDYKGEKQKTSGDYFHLTRILCEPKSPIMRTDNCISFLVAVREEAGQFRTAEERQSYMFEIIQAAARSKETAYRYVAQGDKIRYERALAAVRAEFNGAENLEITQKQIEQSRRYFKAFLSTLPMSTLKLLYHTDQSLAHTDDENLANVMPKGKIPSTDDEVADKSRISQGASDQRFRVLFSASGRHLADRSDWELHARKKALTTIHETLHVAFGRNGANPRGEDWADLKEEVRKLGDEVFAVAYRLRSSRSEVLTQKSELLGETLADILYPQSAFYSGYKWDNVNGGLIMPHQEEVLANILGLVCTEFSEDKTENNPFMKASCPQSELADLQKLAVDLRALYEKIANRVEARAIEQAKKANQVG